MSRGADGVKLWEKAGKAEFIKQWSVIKEKNFLARESKVMKNALFELSWRVVNGQMKVESAINILEDLCENVKELPVAIADVFSVLDIELSVLEDTNQRDKFISLVSGCEKFVASSLLKERLDLETLESLGLLASKSQFNQKYVKTKTKLYYKQKKFNLLREESEGYAKLIAELNQEITEKITVDQSVENLKSLIGCFDLDPNRVLDVLLESFECRPHLENFYVPLFKEYVTERKTLCHILGFKFRFFQDEETPTSLYKVAALLLQHNLIDLETLYPHLLPADAKIKEYHQKEADEAKAYVRKLSVVNLAEKSEEVKEPEVVKIDLYVTNQKLGLCEALLSLGVWDRAKEILDKLPEFFGTVHKPIATGLCAMVHCMMDTLYKNNAGLPKKILKGKLSGDKNLLRNIREVDSYRSLHSEVFPVMRYIGPYTSCDPVLLVKIIRLGKCFMTKRQSGGITPEDDVAYYGFLNMLDEVLLPSMSLLPGNCCLSEELWSFLKLFPYELRYRLYGNWKNDYSQHPKLVRIRADCLERAKYLMKRISKENVKQSGRQLGKLSHSNPGVLFEYVLSQIQTHDNFIGPVVDSLKYLTSLSYDMLAYCIIDALANPDKSRMKYDDTNISKWLQSLANFAGCICRKYQVDLAGLMQYVANQLKAGKSFDLLLLREVVTKMAGIEISEEITDDQLNAMSGGELLRQEGGYFAQVRNTKKSSTRLKDSLLEHDLALALCILMSQQRDGVIYEESAESHLKLVGKLYDQCQDTLVQFGSFLSMQLSTEEFVKRLPTIDTLITAYHVPADAAFFLCRPQYTYAINSKFDELRKTDKNNKQSGSQLKQQRYIEAADEVMQPVVELIRPIYSPRVWEDLSATFFVTFWSMSMYDLAVPTTVYDKQIQQLTSQITAIEDNEDLPQSKKKKEKERCSSLIAKLKDEMKKQGDHCSRVMARLKAQRDSWFISRSTKNETITQFLQLCVFPRCCFTASDAVYCAKFIHILHDLKTPNFSTLICCDRIFCDITYTVTNCTENEAHRYGRFLCASLDTIMKWHSSKEIYDKECAAYPGFVTVFRKGTDSVNIADQLDYENYRHVCHKWHFRITKAMVACLESGNYIQIRNALIVLTKILPNYPKIQQFGQALERRVDRLRQDEKGKRPDIYALAMMYSGQLKGKKSIWVQETMFHHKEMKGNQKKQGGSSSKQDSKANGETKSSKENGEVKESSKEKKSEKKEKSEGKSKSEKKDEDKKDPGTKKSSKDKSKDKEKSKEEKSHKEDKSSTHKEKAIKREVEEDGERGQNKENKRSKEEAADKVEVKIRVKEEAQEWTERDVRDIREGHDYSHGDFKVKEEKLEKIKIKTETVAKTSKSNQDSVKEIFKTMSYGPAPEADNVAKAWLDDHGKDFGVFIDGKWVKPEGRKKYLTKNPATGEDLAWTTQAEKADVDLAVKAAEKAYQSWSKTSPHVRARHLYSIARHIQKHMRLFNVVESLDNGKTIRETRDADIPTVVRHFYHHAGWAQLMETEMRGWKSVGVIGAIVPWNFPLMLLTWKIAPALAMGNTVVLKPATYTRLSALLLAEVCAEAGLPPGVFNVVTGSGAMGSMLAEHPSVDKVAFTGSTGVGQTLRRLTAGSGKKLSLELGGKSPVVVFESADLDSAVEGVVDAIWFNQGQVCSAGSKLLVQEPIYEKMVDKLKERLTHFRVGNSLDKTMDMGAIVDESQRKSIEEYVEEARKEGAEVFQIKDSVPSGCYYPPTIITNVQTVSRVVAEEIFGPVLVVLPFRTAKEALAISNNTIYGLGGSVWTENVPLALEVALGIKAGTVWINCHNLFDAAAGFGGYKQSGYGRDGGKEGLFEYVRPAWEERPRPGKVQMDLKTFGATLPQRPTFENVENRQITINGVTMPSIDRTFKMYYGGGQKRPDAPYVRPVINPDGKVVGHVGEGNRKDVRNAVETAHAAAPGWGKRAAHNRAQIVYYMAENLEIRRDEIAGRIQLMTGRKLEECVTEVDLSIQRLFHWGAYCDKYGGGVQETTLYGATVKIHEPVGVIGMACPDSYPLLGFVSLFAPAVVRGNTMIIIPSQKYPLSALDLYQVFDTSDLPGGVVNILTGDRDHLTKYLTEHQDVQSMWYFGSAEGSKFVEFTSAENVKRTWVNYGLERDWTNPEQGQGEEFLYQSVQVKNIWIPMGDIFAN